MIQQRLMKRNWCDYYNDEFDLEEKFGEGFIFGIGFCIVKESLSLWKVFKKYKIEQKVKWNKRKIQK